jgi:5-methylcytosine-specific restriction endonuclease McrA
VINQHASDDGTARRSDTAGSRRGPLRPCLPHPKASPRAECSRLTPGRTRCEQHEAAYQAWRNARRGDRYQADYQAERRRVLAAATVCSICGRPPSRRDPLTADHIVPAAHGGAAAGNLRPAHRSCNSARGATVRSS